MTSAAPVFPNASGAQVPEVAELAVLAAPGSMLPEDFGYESPTLAKFGRPDAMHYSRLDAEKLMADFRLDLQKAMKPARARSQKEWASVSKAVAPEIASRFPMIGPDPGVLQTLEMFRKAIGSLNADLAKDISIQVPLSSGFVPYDLQAPSKKIFPALSPLRNRLPRTRGQGLSARYKVIDGVTGSQTGGVADIRPTFGEGPQTTGWGTPSGAGGGLTLSRPPRIAYHASDQVISYKFFGLSDSVTWGGEVTSQGYESLRAISSFSLMKSLFMMEEKLLLGGRITALAAPAAPTLTARTAVAGETAITGLTTNIYVKVTAVGQFGESAGSSATAVAPSTQVVDVTVTDVTGALYYNVYVSTGVADPGDASRFFAGKTGWQKFTIQGALPTTGNTVPITDSGTNSANDYDGLYAQLDANGGVAKRLNVALAATSFDNDLGTAFDKYKADPDECFMNAFDRITFSNAIISASATNVSYRIALTPDDQGSIIAGGMVSAMYNKATGKQIKLTVHPWNKQGNAWFHSWALPFPWSEVPNPVEVRLVQDYLQIDWPVIQMTYDTSILGLGALLVYAPTYFLVYHGIPLQSAQPYS